MNYMIEMGEGGTARLPNEYQEVEYIQSSGSQYIDTGIKFQYGYKVKIDVNIPNDISVGTLYISGCDTNYYTNFSMCFAYNAATTSAVFRGIYGTDAEYPNTNRTVSINAGSTVLAGDYSLISTPEKIEINGNSKLYQGTDNFTNLNIYVFTTNRNGNPMLSTNNFAGRIKQYTITDANNVEILKLVPCYRKADNVIGMYDIINDVFYTNAGTGSFTKGALVGLPSEYQEVEYIESTGTQYINTGIKGKSSIEAIYKVNFTSIGAEANAIGGEYSYNTSSSLYLGMVRANGNLAYHYGSSNNPTEWGLVEAHKDYVISAHLYAGSQYMTVDGIQGGNSSYANTFASNYDIYLMAINNITSSSVIYSNLKLYYCKLYDNGVLVRDFIPCYRKSDNAIGLYDLVNGVFYTNAGTGTFLKGNNVLAYKSTPIGVFSGEIKIPKLPSNYQEVEYISFYQTQRINTGISSADDIGCEVKYLTTGNYRTSRVPIGTYSTSEPYYQPMAFWGNYMRYGWNGNNTTVSYQGSLPVNTQIVSKFNYMDDRQVIYQNNVYVSSLPVYTANSYNIYIGPNLMGNIYYAKFTRGQNIIAEFIPCYRKSDNVIGMYDIINGVFYTNAGTGSFDKGPIISLPDEYQEVEYIESTGTQWIDTGVRRGSKGAYSITFLQTSVASICPQYFAGEANTTGKVPKLFLDVTPNIVHMEQGSSFVGLNLSSTDYSTIEFKTNGDVYLNNNYVNSLGGNVGFGEATFWVFNSHSETDLPAAIKLKSLKISDNDVLIRDFIPCYRKSDNVVGLFDRVNLVFYTNIGTGVFGKGADVVSKINITYNAFKTYNN